MAIRMEMLTEMVCTHITGCIPWYFYHSSNATPVYTVFSLKKITMFSGGEKRILQSCERGDIERESELERERETRHSNRW